MSVHELAARDLSELREQDYPWLLRWLESLRAEAQEGEGAFMRSLLVMNALLDRRYPTGAKKRSSVLQLASEAVETLLLSVPRLGEGPGHTFLVDYGLRARLGAPQGHSRRLVIDARGFPPEGDDSLARCLVSAVQLGWRHVLLVRTRGHRFLGCGLAEVHPDCRIDVYGSPGDYLASGLDGGKVWVHASAQDQAGNIMKAGKLVIAGDAGQAFLYAAKGGEVYVLGNVAGRPLINAVGSPKVVINGTALDYLAESFMAGDPLKGGGFVVVNAMGYDLEGNLRELDAPYPGGNLFSLASGGAVYIRDPHHKVGTDQLNGGRLAELTPLDWDAVLPMLVENQRLLGVPVEALLSVGGRRREPREVYRKVEPASLKALKG